VVLPEAGWKMHYLKSLFEFLRKPEWVAAIALLIQAVILFLQFKILGRHAETMEEHKTIAGTQAETAKLIGKALTQQGKILDEQFKFQKRLAAQAEREKVFDLVLELRSRVVALLSLLSSTPVYQLTSPESREQQEFAWNQLGNAILPCEKALITSIHLSSEEKNYFLGYAQAVDALKHTNDVSKELGELRGIEDQYKDFAKMMMRAAQTPESP
jgi:hypothetical protein